MSNPSSKALQLAAQAWCETETERIEMDAVLANAIARILDPILADRDRLKAEQDDFKRYGHDECIAKANRLKAHVRQLSDQISRLEVTNDAENILGSLLAERDRLKGNCVQLERIIEEQKNTIIKLGNDLLFRCICRHDKAWNCLKWCAEHAAMRDERDKLLKDLNDLMTRYAELHDRLGDKP